VVAGTGKNRWWHCIAPAWLAQRFAECGEAGPGLLFTTSRGNLATDIRSNLTKI